MCKHTTQPILSICWLRLITKTQQATLGPRLEEQEGVGVKSDVNVAELVHKFANTNAAGSTIY